MGDTAPQAPELCSAAADAVKRVGALADCALVANDGSSYKVSKGFIAAHATVLGTLLNNVDAAEQLKLDDNPAEVACIVNHVYGGDLFLIDISNLLDCSRMVQKYDMPRLQRAVDAFVKQLQLTNENLPHWMAVAHGDPEIAELKQRCINFAAKRLQSICSARIAKGLQRTDWLEALPQSSLVDLMQRRSLAVGDIVQADCSLCSADCRRRTHGCGLPLREQDIQSLERLR